MTDFIVFMNGTERKDVSIGAGMGKNDTKSARQPMAGNVGATEPEPR
jgi:hypothetical protein